MPLLRCRPVIKVPSEPSAETPLGLLGAYRRSIAIRDAKGLILDSQLVASMTSDADFDDLEIRLTSGHADGRSVASSVHSSRPLLPDDLPFLHQLLATARSPMWRGRLLRVAPHELTELLWDGVTEQVILHRASDGSQMGVVALFDHEPQHGVARIEVTLVPDVHWAIIGPIVAFAQRAFDFWHVRKLYFDLAWPDYEQLAADDGTCFDLELRLRNHEFRGGVYVDRAVCGVTQQHLRYLTGRPHD